MLRSLVGSEMCIRDRLISDNLKLYCKNKTLFLKLVKIIVKASFLYLCPCLLYTSDAADDLLCVDLGGRRIIKKKRQ